MSAYVDAFPELKVVVTMRASPDITVALLCEFPPLIDVDVDEVCTLAGALELMAVICVL